MTLQQEPHSSQPEPTTAEEARPAERNEETAEQGVEPEKSNGDTAEQEGEPEERKPSIPGCFFGPEAHPYERLVVLHGTDLAAVEHYAMIRWERSPFLARARADCGRLIDAEGMNPYDAVDLVTQYMLRWFFEDELERLGEGRILDFGCGAGSPANFGMSYAEIPNPVLAVDLRAPIVAFPDNVEHVQSDLHELTYDGPPFDLAIALHVFEHLLDPLALMQKLRDLLREDGRVLIAVPNGRSLHDILQHRWAGEACDHVNAFTREGIVAAMESVGFAWDAGCAWQAYFRQMYDHVPTVPWGKSLGQILDEVARDLDHANGTSSMSIYGWLLTFRAV